MIRCFWDGTNWHDVEVTAECETAVQDFVKARLRDHKVFDTNEVTKLMVPEILATGADVVHLLAAFCDDDEEANECSNKPGFFDMCRYGDGPSGEFD